ncbi:MAG: hypothetical protein II984_01430 [Clostridia bacterium]|nr:hypothetical protein [Clostridia bacterium]
MNKYFAPTIEIQKIHSADVITASGGVTIGELKGFDNGESKTAIFDAGFWFNN